MLEPKVSIIILNWNRWKDSLECLNSVNKIKYKNFDVYFVDNGSIDQSSDYVRKEFPKVKIIQLDKNYGFAKGNNEGIKKIIKKAKSKYILLLNNDTIVKNNFLNELVNTAEKDNKIGLVGPIIYNYYKKNNILSRGAKINFFTGQIKHLKSQIESKKIDYLEASALLIRSDVFKKIGLINEKYFTYWEDADFCLRVKKHNFNLVLSKNSKIWHKGSLSNIKGNKVFYFTRNKLIFIRKYASHFQFLSFLFFFFIIYIPYFLIFKKNFLFNKEECAAFIKGIKEGIK